MLSPTVALVYLGFIQSVASLLEGNIGELHFTIPEEAKDFDDAVPWCKNKYSSTLAVINNSSIQTALQQFLESRDTATKPTMYLYINLRIYQEQTASWFLITGSTYNGQILNQNPPTSFWTNYLLYCHLRSDPGSDPSHYPVVAATPGESRYYICQYDENRCSRDSANNIVYNGRCYVKYENERVTWYQARERCVKNGGDLATFQSNPSNSWLSPAQFNTSWLSSSSTYWVGIRYRNWAWRYIYEDNQEAIFTSWSNEKPNNYSYNCVCVDPNGNPSWNWTDCDCSMPRQFVCLKKVAIQTTTLMTTTQNTTTIKLITTTNSNQTVSAASTGLNIPMIIGLAVGIGGGGLIILIVLIVVLVVLIKRRQREKSNSNGGVNHFVKATSASMEANGSTEVVASDAHYEHLKNNNGLGTEMPLYEQLNQTEIPEYERVL